MVAKIFTAALLVSVIVAAPIQLGADSTAHVDAPKQDVPWPYLGGLYASSNGYLGAGRGSGSSRGEKTGGYFSSLRGSGKTSGSPSVYGGLFGSSGPRPCELTIIVMTYS
jgi:hypothetical protein